MDHATDTEARQEEARMHIQVAAASIDIVQDSALDSIKGAEREK